VLANRLRAWGPAIAWAVILFVLSAQPDLPGPRRIPFGDKLGHLLLYAVFGLLLAFGRARAPKAVPHVLLLMAGALYGLSDEWHQTFVPGRVPDLADWGADVLGLLTGYALGVARWRRTDANDDSRGSA
jgi:VanZ family protein